MRLLLAAMNRDLLSAYGRILTERIGETVTVFDGTQIMNMPDGERYDAAVIDSRLPHSDYRVLADRFRRSGTPVIVLIYSAVGTEHLLDDAKVAEYLPLPFEPDDLVKAVERSVEAYSGTADGAGPGTLKARILEKSNMTVSEASVLDRIMSEREIDSDREGAYVTSLNEKLRRIQRPGETLQIRYESKRGFKLVDADEQG